MAKCHKYHIIQISVYLECTVGLQICCIHLKLSRFIYCSSSDNQTYITARTIGVIFIRRKIIQAPQQFWQLCVSITQASKSCTEDEISVIFESFKLDKSLSYNLFLGNTSRKNSMTRILYYGGLRA